MQWLATVGLVLSGLALLLLILLAIPAELSLRVERTDRTRFEIVVGWLAGRLPQQLARTGGPEQEDRAGTGAAEAPEASAEPGPTDPGPSKLDRARQGLALVRSPGFLAHTRDALIGLVRSFSVHRLALWGTLGTGDPADTGQLYGRIQAGMPAVWATRRIQVDLTPDFDRAVLEGGGELVLRARPLRLIWRTLVYALSPTTLRALHAAWRARPDA